MYPVTLICNTRNADSLDGLFTGGLVGYVLTVTKSVLVS